MHFNSTFCIIKNSYILIFGKNKKEGGGGVEMLIVLVNIKQQWYFYQNWKQFDVSLMQH